MVLISILATFILMVIVTYIFLRSEAAIHKQEEDWEKMLRPPERFKMKGS